ncbi:hypothetical protein [Lactiplantibacillus pentosus]|uniref:hypothetical protein n=1 Tax=Lactiplantibacillus pentosus TaxID=1589 RepID=UPI0021823E89|nr:hypothetical protein [Lactiplantibacillus pentosus]MCT0163838.1 hypothetical protein [Lactiplantibacillus pentosus]
MTKKTTVDPSEIRELDIVELIDGREATIVFVPKDPTTGFEADVGSGPENWETIGIRASQIKRILWHAR